MGEVTSGDEALRADLEEVTCAFHGMVLCQEKSQNVRLWCNLRVLCANLNCTSTPILERQTRFCSFGDLTSQKWFQITCGSDAQVSFSCGSCKNVMISTISLLAVPLCVLHDCKVKIRGDPAWGHYTWAKVKTVGNQVRNCSTRCSHWGSMLSLNQRVSRYHTHLGQDFVHGTNLGGKNDL